MAVCDLNADCTDLNGTFECTCQQGFSGDGTNCSGKLMLHVVPVKKKLVLSLY